MKILFNWLKEFIDIELTPEQLADRLNSLGIEVARLENLGQGLENVVVGEILESQAHPQADRLSVCVVFDGKTKRQIVCGAKNFKAGDKAPLALPGAKLPNGVEISVAKLRGIESQGMLCSEEELGLPSGSAPGQRGIMILRPEATPGEPLARFLGLNDTVLEVEITPNRGDLLSHLGIARELSLAFRQPIRWPAFSQTASQGPCQITVDSSELCPRYQGRVLEGAVISPSPQWMVQRLAACGIRSINNAVDITNYVMLELGQPLHVFDLAKLSGRQIRVRRAQEGERLLALDGKEYPLTPEMLVIADEKKPAAIAGVMGGELSAVTDKTTDIFLESACFDPLVVRRTSRRLGLSSESSYRFERGTDYEGVARASARASQLLQELCQAKETGSNDLLAKPRQALKITVRTERVNQRLGTAFSPQRIYEILESIGSPVEKQGSALVLTAPPHRRDLEKECDLWEEIARLEGYENIPQATPDLSLTRLPVSPVWALEKKITSLLTGLGLQEAMHYSFLSEKSAQRFGYSHQSESLLMVQNPLSAEWAYLRPSLIPGLLESLSRNFHHAQIGIRLYETGHVFTKQGSQIIEQNKIAIGLSGLLREKAWNTPEEKIDFHTLSGMVQALLESLKITGVTKAAEASFLFHPAESVLYKAGSDILGQAGQLHPEIANGYDLPGAAYFLEWDLDILAKHLPEKISFKPLPSYPAVYRDLSVVLPKQNHWEDVVGVIQRVGGQLLEDVRLFDVYEGKGLPENSHSLAFQLTYRSNQETLTDKTVEALQQKILQALKEKFGAILRTVNFEL